MQNSQGRVIRVQKPSKPTQNIDFEEVLTRFCIHFPQYTFSQARKVPFARIKKMLIVAEKQYYLRMIDQVEIAMSSLSQKGSQKPFGDSLIEKYKKILRELT